MIKRFCMTSLATLLVNPCVLWAGERSQTKSTPELAGENHTTMQGHQLRPLWTISDLRLTSQSLWGNEEAKKWLFKSLEVSPGLIQFNGKECQPHMTTSTISRDELIHWAGGLALEDLKIPEGLLQLISTGCRPDGLEQYVRLPDRRLLIQMHKVIFVLQPNINY